MAAVVAMALGAGAKAKAADADLLREEMGVKYEELVAEIRAAYEDARRDAMDAGESLLRDDGNGYDTSAADAAMARYEAAVERVRELREKFATVYDKLPLLFVELEYLIVKSLGGMAAIFSLRGDPQAALETRQTLIGLADENRARIAFAFERNVLPQFHEQYRAIDDSFRLAQTESYIWMGHDAENVGSLADARAYYELALEHTDDAAGQEAVRALLERVTAAENAAMVPAHVKPPESRNTRGEGEATPVDAVAPSPPEEDGGADRTTEGDADSGEP